MVKLFNRESLEEIFFDAPSDTFSARELARKIGISHPTVLTYLDALKKRGFVRREKHGYCANITPSYRPLRRINIITRIHTSGLLEYISTTCQPNTIILFGSTSRGEDSEQSDIDLFIDAPETVTKLGSFEKTLHRKINLTFGSFSRLTPEFKNSLVNGTILYGGIRL